MEYGILFQGIVIGLSIAAPIGPIGILCIQRSISRGSLHGFVSGLGAAGADAVYGAIAAFGIAVVTTALIALRFWLTIMGGLFLCYLGIRVFSTKPPQGTETDGRSSLFSDLATAFGLTLANPMTILSFGAVYIGMGVNQIGDLRLSATFFVLGIFLGSALWWFILSNAAGFFRKRIGPKVFLIINKASGLIILGFGVFLILGSIFL